MSSVAESGSLQPLAPLTLGEAQIPLWERGQGNHVLFVLPGYRQTEAIWDQWLPAAPAGWRFVLLGMPGALRDAGPADPIWHDQHWLALLQALRERFSPAREAWLGYSLGGRLLLHLCGLPQADIRQALLMSPDGLQPSTGERWFLYHRCGQRPLAYLVRYPDRARRLVDRLHRLGIMSDSGHYFAQRQLRDPESLAAGFHAARMYVEAQPRRRRLQRVMSERHLRVWAIWGEKDRVRPVSQARQLWNLFPEVHLTTVPGGHTWPQNHPELLQAWLLEVLA